MAARVVPILKPCLRSALTGLNRGEGTNVGLWLDKYLPTQAQPGANEVHPRAAHIGAVCEKACPEGWADFVERWTSALKSAGSGANVVRFFCITTQGRCVVGLGAESPWENSIRLHRTWGVPTLPGSSLKGLAAAWAHQGLEGDAWRKALGDQKVGDAHRTLFGVTDEQGCVVFHDAVWSDKNKDNGLRADVMTVHHPKYYQEGIEAPIDWDSPTPIPFLSLTGSFIFALEGPEAWVEAAADLLAGGLSNLGIGAKTSSGYGRMTLDCCDPETRTPSKRLSAAEQKKRDDATMQELKDRAGRLASLPAGRRDEALRELENVVQTSALNRAAVIAATIGTGSSDWLDRLQNYLGAVAARSPDLEDSIEEFVSTIAARRAPVAVPAATPAFDVVAFVNCLPDARDDGRLKAIIAAAAPLTKPGRKLMKESLAMKYGPNTGGWIDALLKE